jgi:hypothetical protein
MSTIKPALTLIGLPQSTCTTRLLLVFLEKGLEFSLYAPDLANGELKVRYRLMRCFTIFLNPTEASLITESSIRAPWYCVYTDEF